ncbi:phosphatidate cytidylyltransferase [Aquabacterium sp. NJ1]|uniref:phosphatidate cytidylyltransferase n=1 Tax=Aquabacterium sp. NJ1 TaxID=1538295 RepID=UPI00052BAAA7|nr:phosphatidate cytidylyltransferase [Aquabacterium sp. NJ1]KGM40837.1 phosphatidate cytidylyltransferase [Aquabacterium sp. NJ1]
MLSMNHLLFDEATRWLFAGTLGVLVLASVIGGLLKWRVAKGLPHGVIDNLNSRIKAWWVMVTLIGLSFIFGKTGVIILFAFMSFAALREYITLAYTRSGDHMSLVLMFYVALPMQYFLIWIEWYGLFSIFIPVHVFLVLPIVSSLRGDTTRFLERTAKMQWGLMICVFCVSHVPALLTLQIPGYQGRELLLIAYLIAVVQGSDVLQYVWGKLMGKRKVAPELSPSKTVEGLVGGVVSATLLGAAMYGITPFTPWQSALIALAICLMGFLGGLVMSAIKRDRGVKDWGAMIEGHGGMLDRLDSVVFAAPMFFHVVRFWWVP